LRDIEGTYYSYRELHKQIHLLSKEYQALGLREGERVALIAKKDKQTILSFFALLYMGASPCILSTRLPKEKISLQLNEGKISHYLEEGRIRVGLSRYFFSTQEILLFTSGSQGRPKLAHLQEAHFIANAEGALAPLGLQTGSHYFLSTPLFHVSGLIILFRCLLSGACIELTPSLHTTHGSLVPTQLLRWLRDGIPCPALQCLLLGGAPISEALLQRALEKSLPIRTTYGLTEMASQVTLSVPGEIVNNAGVVLPGRELDISPDGEILVRGRCLFSGYDFGEEVHLPLTQEGWFPTGDLGRISPNGHLEWLGRKDNLFISGGENLYPEEIERALGSFPGILCCIVVPIDDQEYGQRPIAFIQSERNMPPREALYEHLSPMLPKFAFPTSFHPFPQEFLQEGKISRHQLRLFAQKCNFS